MISFDNVSFRYRDDQPYVLQDINWEVDEGEMCLLVGKTGSGKSTLLKAINGLVPHFTGGMLHGRVTVAGRDTATHPPRDLADVVGMVIQDPMSGFVTDMVEDELAYGMESLGLPEDVMRKRVEETLDLMGLSEVRHRPLLSLSGGQRQRVAIGSVLTTHPDILVLDEPTSALDPGAAEDVLSTLQRLVYDVGLTVILAEHRLERVVQYVDSVAILRDHRLEYGPPAEMMITSPVAPPVVELGRLMHWSPLPLSVRDARRSSRHLRHQLAELSPPEYPTPQGATVLQCHNVSASYGSTPALREANLNAQAGEILALMGRNGAGKSSLMKAAVGLLPVQSGRIRVNDHDPATLTGKSLIHQVGLVPQEPADLLCADSVARECSMSDEDAGVEPGTTVALLTELASDIDPAAHPHDLSEGQRLILVLSIILAARPPLLLLDEPTRGLDYSAKERLVAAIRSRAAAGTAIVMATHDVELVAEVADRVAIMAEGEVVAQGTTDDIVVASPLFAPQVAKVVAPLPWLTVAEVSEALEPA